MQTKSDKFQQMKNIICIYSREREIERDREPFTDPHSHSHCSHYSHSLIHSLASVKRIEILKRMSDFIKRKKEFTWFSANHNTEREKK